MLDKLRQTCNVISLEAAVGGNAADKAAEKLPSLFDQASEFLSRGVLEKVGNFFSGYSRSLAWLSMNGSRGNYAELRGLQVHVPQGFKGSLVEYGNVLTKAVDEMSSLERDVLGPFSSWLQQRIADPESLKALSNSLKIPGLHEPKIEGIQKQLDRFFPDKADASTALYGEVIKRQADWADLFNLTKKLNTQFGDGTYEAIQKRLPELSDLLTVLSERLREDKGSEVYQFSSVNVEKLSKVVYQVAEHLEFYGVLRSRVDEYLRAVSDNVEIVRPHI